VRAIAAETQPSYGRRRMAKPLPDEGVAVGRGTARRLMQQAGVAVRRARPHPPLTTDSRYDGVAPHLLARPCDVERSAHAGVGEITSVWIAEGWLPVAVLLDLYSRKVVGWAMIMLERCDRSAV
jgi:putative transposase